MSKAVPHRRGGVSRGALAAIIVSLIPIFLVAWFVLRGTRAGDPSLSAAGEDLAPAVDLPPVEGNDAGALLGATGLNVHLMDKKDPTRLAGELTSEQIEPLEARRYLVERPQAWFYLEDGRTIHVRADRGRLYMPDQQSRKPESGTVEGNVVARLFAAREDGRRPDPERDRPLGRMDTRSLTFDLTLGEVSTMDPVEITSDEIDAYASNLKIIVNEVRQRAEGIDVLASGWIRYKPKKSEDAEPRGDRARAAAGAQEAGDAGVAAGDGAPPRETAQRPEAGPVRREPDPTRETLYSIVFSDDVVIMQEQRTARGDRLQIWARTIDNKLPDGAIAEIRTAEAEPSRPGAGGAPAGAETPAGAGSQPAEDSPVVVAQGGGERAPVTQGAQEAARAEDGSITLKWAGSCVIRPIGVTPPELEEDHVALRFTAENTGLVRFEDRKSQASGHCAVLEYRATTRRATLSGPGPESVMLSAPGYEVAMVRADADLTAGVIGGSGPMAAAELIDRGPDLPPLRRQISCTERYDLLLRMEDGALTSSLQQAVFSGGVRATDRDASLTADSLRTDFVATAGDANSLSRLVAEGNVVASSDRSGTLRSRFLDVAFRPDADGRDPRPTDVTAEGGVIAARDGEELRCDRLEAQLARDGSDDTVVTAAVARGNAAFFGRKDGVSAEADEIRARPEAEIVDLIGERVAIRRGENTTITGTQMRLDGINRRLAVFGAGTFEHAEAGDAGTRPSRVVASWSMEMNFDDGTGLVECVGDAVATSAPDPLTSDRVEAHTIRIELEPRPTDTAAGSAAGAPKDPADDDRRVLRAIAYGEALEHEGGAPAKVESRRYAPAAAGAGAQPTLEQLLFLEGPSIVADNAQGTLVVDHPGRMFLVDARRAADASRESAPGARGSTLFEWAGSLRMDRADGTIDMRRTVRMTHRRLGDDQITDLESERLTAKVRRREGEQGSGDEFENGELVAATAAGAVYVRSAERELIADMLEYDAQRGVAAATAVPGGVVTMFDGTATVVTAEELFWDLIKDDVRIRKPGPVVAPR